MRFREAVLLLLIIEIFLYASASAEYIDNGNGTVTDTGSCLMWQQATASGMNLFLDYNSYCHNLALGGYSDWRLPTVRELSILVDSTINTSGPTGKKFFPDTGPLNYWSSTTRPVSSQLWTVLFYSGSSHDTKVREDAGRVVRCVRDAD